MQAAYVADLLECQAADRSDVGKRPTELDGRFPKFHSRSRSFWITALDRACDTPGSVSAVYRAASLYIHRDLKMRQEEPAA